MHVQIRPYRRAHPQRIADLAALVRYLLEAKDTESDQNHQLRLAGPPVISRVVQRLSPFGGTVREAAYDLAQQVFNHARESQIAGNLPPEIYKHLILSFPVHQPLNRKFKELTQRSAERRVASDFQIIVRVVRELLDSMGIGDVPPLIIVVHNDTKHLHAHVVVGLYANDLDCSGVVKGLKPSLIKKIASTLYAAHRWPFPSEALERQSQLAQLWVTIVGAKVRATAGQPWRNFAMNAEFLPEWLMQELVEAGGEKTYKANSNSMRAHLARISNSMYPRKY